MPGSTAEPLMNLQDVQAVIDSAKARGMDQLEGFIRRRVPGMPEAKVQEAAEVAVEIIESVPIFLARASQEARSRRMVKVVQPVLDHAERYFLRPVDLIPEMTQGLAGLLDDTYLVLRILQNLDRGPQTFLDWDLDFPVAFLRSLVGEDIGRKLDAISVAALQEVSQHLSLVWDHVAHEA
ncbi:hypothetical protein ACFL3S_06145 [Gemmatimonadota bacterium]